MFDFKESNITSSTFNGHIKTAGNTVTYPKNVKYKIHLKYLLVPLANWSFITLRL